MLSPEVLASHQATLELQARDEDRLAPPSEALTALEEELVARHQRELAIAAERDRLRRELAGVGRERLDELRKAQSEDLARLDRETAARAAERAALAEEVAALERAAHVEEPVTARSSRSVRSTRSQRRTLSDAKRDLQSRDASLRVRTAPEAPRPTSGEALDALITSLASPAGIAAQERRIAELRAEAQPRPPPSRASEDWSPSELLDAWLEGDPRGLLQGAGRPRTPQPAAPTPRAPTPKAPTPRVPTPKAPTPRQPTPVVPQQQPQQPYGFQQTSPGMPPYGYAPPSYYAPPPPQPAPQQDSSSLLQFQMMQLQQQQQQQRFDDQLRIFKEETARQSREAVETLRRENAQLLTEVQRLKERHVTPKSSRRPKTPVRDSAQKMTLDVTPPRRRRCGRMRESTHIVRVGRVDGVDAMPRRLNAVDVPRRSRKPPRRSQRMRTPSTRHKGRN